MYFWLPVDEVKNNESKWTKRLALLALGFVLLLFGSLSLLLLPSIQRKVAHYALNTYIFGPTFHFHSDYLQLNPNGSLHLENVTLAETNGQSIYAIRGLDLSVKYLSISPLRIELDYVALNEPTVNFLKAPGDSVENLDRFMQLFGSSDTLSTDTADFLFAVDSISILNGKFNWWNFNAAALPHTFDMSHLAAHSLNISASQLGITTDTIRVNIGAMAFSDTSGLNVKHLHTDFVMHNDVISLRNLFLQTQATQLAGFVDLKHDNFEAFDNAIDDLKMDICINPSKLWLQDVAYFSGDLWGLRDTVNISALFKGTVANFRIRELDLSPNDQLRLIADISAKGLPEIDETFLDINVKSLAFNYRGLVQLPIPPFEQTERLSMPSQIKSLKRAEFNGKLTGFITDFVAYGNLVSNLGNVQTDLQLYAPENENLSSYKGQLSAQGLSLGLLLNDQQNFNQTTFNLAIEGSGFELEKLDTRLEGRVDYIDIANYRYKDVRLKGIVDKQMFEGDLDFKDENGRLAFDGIVDLNNSSNPVFDFKLEVDSFKLGAYYTDLQLSKAARLKLYGDFDFVGSDIDLITGKALVSCIEWYQNDTIVLIDTLVFTADGKGEGRLLSLHSDLVDAKIFGRFKLLEAPEATRYIVGEAFPNIIAGLPPKQFDSTDFRFTATAKPHPTFYDLFTPSIEFLSPLELAGGLNGQKRILSLDVNNQLAEVKGLGKVSGAHLNTELSNGIFTVVNDVENIQVTDTISIKNISLYLKGLGNQVQFNGNWQNQGNFNRYSGDVSGTAQVYTDSLTVEIYPSTFTIGDTLWQLASAGLIYLDTQSVVIPGIEISTGGSSIKVDGNVHRYDSSALHLSLLNLDLSLTSLFLPQDVLKLNGYINGEAMIVNPAQNLVFESDFNLTDIAVFDELIGSGQVISTYDDQTKSVNLNAQISNNYGKDFKVTGTYLPLGADTALDLKVLFNELALTTINPFVEGYASNLDGELHGSLSITGGIDAPQINGVLAFDTLRATVDYLQTKYTILPNSLMIEPDWLGFDFVDVIDEKGGKANMIGTIAHENFDNINLNLSIDAKNFLMLNTTAKDNDLFYGTAPLTGMVNIDGYTDNLELQLTAKTDRPTLLSLPVSNVSSVDENQFIRFVDFSDTSRAELPKEKLNLEGVSMNFELEVTEDAEAKIIFDETAGDIMRVVGKGDLNMVITTDGDFNIYGTYNITQGDYLFTLQNIINKRFKLQSGSSITWNGDPFEANMNIVALYKTRSTLKALGLPLPDSSLLNRRLNVDLELVMRNKLLTPDISFNIRVPSVDQSIQDIISASLATEEQINRQVFSLLLFGSFAPLQEGVANEGGGVGSNSFELLSNQLSNWLSQFSDKLDVGVNYRTSNTAQDEVSVDLATQLFNNRLIIEGSVGNSNEQQTANGGSALVGDFNIEYLITENGKIRARAYQRSNDNNNVNANASPTTQGAGLTFREEFNTWGEFFEKVNPFKGAKKP